MPVGNASNCCPNADSCASRLKELEAEVTVLKRTLSAKDVQLASLKDGRRFAAGATDSLVDASKSHYQQQQQQVFSTFHHHSQQQQQQLNGERHGSGRTAAVQLSKDAITSKLGGLEEENRRLKDTLKEEDKMKQKLMTAYHTSLKEVSELNC